MVYVFCSLIFLLSFISSFCFSFTKSHHWYNSSDLISPSSQFLVHPFPTFFLFLIPPPSLYSPFSLPEALSPFLSLYSPVTWFCLLDGICFKDTTAIHANTGTDITLGLNPVAKHDRVRETCTEQGLSSW